MPKIVQFMCKFYESSPVYGTETIMSLITTSSLPMFITWVMEGLQTFTLLLTVIQDILETEETLANI